MTTKTRTTARRVQASDIHPELEDLGKRKIAPAVWAVTRIGLGFIFIWAFVDKLFGLGRGRTGCSWPACSASAGRCCCA